MLFVEDHEFGSRYSVDTDIKSLLPPDHRGPEDDDLFLEVNSSSWLDKRFGPVEYKDFLKAVSEKKLRKDDFSGNDRQDSRREQSLARTDRWTGCRVCEPRHLVRFAVPWS